MKSGETGLRCDLDFESDEGFLNEVADVAVVIWLLVDFESICWRGISSPGWEIGGLLGYNMNMFTT